MADFLLEFMCEEIPARMQLDAAEQLKKLALDWLMEQGLKNDTVTTYVSPRRLALIIEGLPLASEAKEEERRGPRVDAPEKALEGFLRSTGLAKDQLEQRDTGKGVFYFAVTKTDGQQTATLLQTLPADILANFKWQKSMRWGSSSFKWVRPLQQILAMFDGKPLQGGVDVSKDTGPAWQASGESEYYPYTNITVGHRAMSQGIIEIKSATDYVETLRQYSVLVNQAERRQRIIDWSEEFSVTFCMYPDLEPALLEEVVGLSEWPVPLFAGVYEPSDSSFDLEDLPSNLVRTAMVYHQKYFPIYYEYPRTGLAPHCVVVADLDAPDGGKAIIAGNERVLRARLDDALFMYRQDLATPLADFNAKLSKMVFHKKLGMVAERVERFQQMAPKIYTAITGSDAPQELEKVRLAASHMKADLVSGVVGEFPELQGQMGGIYAAKELQNTDMYAASDCQEIGDAIAQQYLPVGNEGEVPSTPSAQSLALAEKLDALLCFFAIDEKPTGSKDPFALRRAAYGVLYILLARKISVDLPELLTAVYCHDNFNNNRRQVVEDVTGFIEDRLTQYARQVDLLAVDYINAVAPDKVPHYSLLERYSMAKNLYQFFDYYGGPDRAERTATGLACTRVLNIIDIELRKDAQNPALSDSVDYRIPLFSLQNGIIKTHDGLRPSEAIKVKGADEYSTLFDAARQYDETRRTGDDMTRLKGLMSLTAPINAYFDAVLINDEDPKARWQNLSLLAYVGAVIKSVADFQELRFRA